MEMNKKQTGNELGMDGKFITTAWDINMKYVGNIQEMHSKYIGNT